MRIGEEVITAITDAVMAMIPEKLGGTKIK